MEKYYSFIKMVHSIYSVLFCLYLFAKLFGLAPYRLKFEKRRVVYKIIGKSIIQTIIITGLSLCMIYCKVKYMSLTSLSKTRIGIMLGFTAYCKIISAIIAIVVAWYKETDLRRSLEKLMHYDKCLSKLNISDSNLPYYIHVITSVTISFMFPIAMQILGYIFNEEPVALVIYNSLSRGLECIIHFLVATYLNMYMLMVYMKLRCLHSLMQKFQDSDLSLQHNPVFALNLVCKMYHDLCTGASHFNKVFSFAFLFMVILNMLEFLLFIYAMAMQRVLDEEMIICGVYNLTIVVMLLMPGGFIHKKSKGLARYLTESTLCYKDHTMNTIMRSFMLQTMHQEIQFQASGCFMLSISTFPEQLTFCVSLLFFLNDLVATIEQYHR